MYPLKDHAKTSKSKQCDVYKNLIRTLIFFTQSKMSHGSLARSAEDQPSSLDNDASSSPILSTSRSVAQSSKRKETDAERQHKLLVHRNIELDRRRKEAKHLRELSSLIKHWHGSPSPKLFHIDLLNVASEVIEEINAQHQSDTLNRANLTAKEQHFLEVEASNTFLFVTAIHSFSGFPISYVTESISRILDLTPEQWLHRDLRCFVHPDDLADVQMRLMSLDRLIGVTVHLECRLQTGSNGYTSVVIDGKTKWIDQTLKPVSPDQPGYLAFIGLCHIPLVKKYNEINLTAHKNHGSLVLHCRCLPNTWRVFLVDGSVSTMPNISSDLFVDRSILEFLSPAEQNDVHQILTSCTGTLIDDVTTCHFLHPIDGTSILMTLEIKPIVNPQTQQVDFLDLHFENLFWLLSGSAEMCS